MKFEWPKPSPTSYPSDVSDALLLIQTQGPEGNLNGHLRMLQMLVEAGLRLPDDQPREKVGQQELRANLESIGNRMPEKLSRWKRDAPRSLETVTSENDQMIVHDLIKMVCANTTFAELHTALHALGTEKDKKIHDYLRHIIFDLPWTKRLMNAARNAVKIKHKRSEEYGRSHDLISVCDIGCGAFPLLAIVSALESPNVIVTCYERDAYAASCAEIVVRSFGLHERIHIVHSDIMEENSDEKFDIVIPETFQPGLTNDKTCQILQRVETWKAPYAFVIPKYVDIQTTMMTAGEYGGGGSRDRHVMSLVGVGRTHAVSSDGRTSSTASGTAPTASRRYEMSQPPDVIRLSIPLGREERVAVLNNTKNMVIAVQTRIGFGANSGVLSPDDSVMTGTFTARVEVPQLERIDFGPNPDAADVSVVVEYVPGEPVSRISAHIEVIPAGHHAD